MERGYLLVVNVVNQFHNANRWRVPDRMAQVVYEQGENISRSVRMLQLRTSLHFHFTPIVMINYSLAVTFSLFYGFLSVAPSPQGHRTRGCLGCATGGSGEVGIREHSS